MTSLFSIFNPRVTNSKDNIDYHSLHSTICQSWSKSCNITQNISSYQHWFFVWLIQQKQSSVKVSQIEKRSDREAVFGNIVLVFIYSLCWGTGTTSCRSLCCCCWSAAPRRVIFMGQWWLTTQKPQIQLERSRYVQVRSNPTFHLLEFDTFYCIINGLTFFLKKVVPFSCWYQVVLRYKLNFHQCTHSDTWSCASGNCGTQISSVLNVVDQESSGEWCQREGILTNQVPSNAPFQLQWVNHDNVKKETRARMSFSDIQKRICKNSSVRQLTFEMFVTTAE